MEILAWLAWGFVCTSIGMIVGNRITIRKMDRFVTETIARHHAEVLRQIEINRKQQKKGD